MKLLINPPLLALSAIAAFTVLSACAKTPDSASAPEPVVNLAAVQTSADSPVTPVANNAALPLVKVHKSASCGCCGSWVEHLQKAGYKVQVNNTDDLNPIKERLGVPYGMGSCHTAEIDGYVVEGHVPVGDIQRLLTERPQARGLVLPGMPIGSPGMEVPDGRVQPYTVGLVLRDGTVQAFSEHGPNG